MPMSNKGLNKLMEECGELTQIAAKKAAYPDTDYHPDGKGSMLDRLEEEIGDVLAACLFVATKFNLDREFICRRSQSKFDLFNEWDRT